MKTKRNFIEERDFVVEWQSKVPSYMVEEQELLRPKYEPQHPLELETKKFINSDEEVQKGVVHMGLTAEDLKALDIPPHETTYHIHENFFNIQTITMQYEIFANLKSGLKRYVEFTEDEIRAGQKFAHEIRGHHKEYVGEMNDKGKIVFEKKQLPMTEKKIANAVSFMKKISILVVEREFELRFKNFKNCHDVEQESWAYQVPEAKAVLKNPDAPTPFLNILAITRGIPKDILVKKVIEKHDKYILEYASLLGKYHAIRSQFKNCDNMWDMNILYEDYFHIGMPSAQGIAMGRMDEDQTRLNGELKYGTFGF